MKLACVALLACCIPGLVCGGTNAAPSEAETGAFVAAVRRAVESGDRVALRSLCASSDTNPFHRPVFLSYIEQFPTNEIVSGTCLVVLTDRNAAAGDERWCPAPAMTISVELRTPTLGFGIRHPVGLVEGRLRFCDLVGEVAGDQVRVKP